MSVTIILPISRDPERILTNLNELECSADTSLLLVVDGDQKLFLKARNFPTKFNSLVVQFKGKSSPSRFSQLIRRWRISAINNLAGTYLADDDFVCLMEDDGIYEPQTLNKLLKAKKDYISGWQIGRWGLSYCGIWSYNSFDNPTTLESLLPYEDKEVDATGLYCCLMRTELYKNHDFQPFDNGQAGPDLRFGQMLRQQGIKLNVDWSLNVPHIDKNGKAIDKDNTVPKKIMMEKKNGRWRFINPPDRV